VILDDYQGVALKFGDWNRLRREVDVKTVNHHISNETVLATCIEDAEIVVIMRERTPFLRPLFERLPKLRLLVTTGMRNMSVDLAAATAHGVTVCGTRSAEHPPTELTWALILGLARQIMRESSELRANGPWQNTVGTDLHGRRLGLVGLGRIGTEVARIGQAFGMKVQAWSPNLTQERADAAGVDFIPSRLMLAESSDFLSMHLVLAPQTRGILGDEELRRMPAHAFLINTSRAALVDQRALIEVLEEGRIAGAGLDVFETEPLPSDHPFRRLANVLATPHIGYVSSDNYRTYFSEAIENITEWLKGTPIRQISP
jgi:phosphoglycerate dehydrogenase-like enzyme